MSLTKGLSILDVLSQPPFEYRIGEISDRTGLNRTTVYRIVKMLTGRDFVLYSPWTKKYRVGPMAHHVGSVYASTFNCGKKIEETLEAVANETRESVGFAVREGDKIISLYEVETHQPFRMNYRAGELYPMNRGCYGKCLMAYHDRRVVEKLLRSQKFEKILPNTLVDPDEILAEYDRIRDQGWVVSVGETLSDSAVGVGVPVFTRSGQVSGCMVVAFIKGTDWEARLESYLQILKEHARDLSRYIP